MDLVKKVPFMAIGDAEIGCIVVGEGVDEELYFDSIDLCNALGFNTKDSRKQALRTHVHPDDKTKFETLLSLVQGGKNIPLDGSVGKVIFINESGLYSLAFGSKKPFARLFKRWVTKEVLPQIRKTGSYSSNYHYWRNETELGESATKRWSEVKRLAKGREDELHYKVVEHIKNRYPKASLNFGGGEHFQTDHARMDAYLKGYQGGCPDLTVTFPLPSGFHWVVAVELKNPNGRGHLDTKQIRYHKSLKDQSNVETIVSCDYDSCILQLHDRYQDVFARAQTPAIADQPEPKYDFATNDNPKYWCNKLKNGTALMHECEKRGIPKDEIYIKTNREIASILITFDKEQNND
jgi:prophage antirepressor-like protein